MLIIGDDAIAQLNPKYDVKRVEVIGLQEQLGYVTNLVNTSLKIKTRLGKYTNSFPLKHSKELIVHNANESEILLNLLDDTISSSWNFKYACPKLLYCIELIKVTEEFKDVFEWEKAVKNFNYLLRNFILPIKKHEPRILTILEARSKKLYPFVTSSDLITTKVFKNREFGTYTEKDIHNIFALNRHTNFLNVTYGLNNTNLIKVKWMTCSLEQQYNIVLERVYVLAINEFIIPYWLKNKKFPTNVKEIIKRSFMILVCEMHDEQFSMFIIYNYSILINKINKNFINLFSNAVKFGDLEITT